MRTYQYPKCCKVYNINDFPYDSYGNSWYTQPPKVNYERIKRSVLRAEKRNHYYPEVLMTAAVTNHQSTSKKVLEDLGYELVQEINNPDYGDGIVWFYKKLLVR